MSVKTPIVLAVAAAMTLGACTDPATQTDNPRQRTQEGAVIGGLLGAIVGAQTGDDSGERRRGALIGGLVGAGVGAAIGYNLDQQAAELQRDFADDRIQIINNGDELVVRMPQDILFDVDSAVVKPALQSDLRVLAQSLQKYPGSTVQVVGHTDNTGTATYNQDLSVRRAGAVSGILIGAGVDPARIRSFGRGEDQPIATNLTPEGRALNRRVDITIRPDA